MGLVGWLAQRSPLLCRIAVQALPNPIKLLTWKTYERWLLTFRLPAGQMAFCNSLEVVDEVLKRDSVNFPKSRFVTVLLRPLIGDGVFGQGGGPNVKAKRRAYFLALAELSEQEVDRVARELTREYVARWLREGDKVAVPQELSRLTIDIVSQLMFGTRFTEAESRQFVDTFFTYHQKASAVLLLCSSGRADATQDLVNKMGLKAVGETLRTLIDQRFVAPFMQEKDGGFDPQHPDVPYFHRLIREVIDLKLEGETAVPVRQQIHDEISVLILAGHETTASVLSWLFWELSSPESYRGNLCLNADAAPVELMTGLINETLRLYPPIAFFLRDVEQEALFRGKTLSAGSSIVVSPWTLQRHKSFWHDPANFCPARWFNGNKAEDAELPTQGEDTQCPFPRMKRPSFIPFGAGTRICPGKNFAEVEMRAILSEVVAATTFSRRPGPAPQPLGALTTRPDYNFRFEFQPRPGPKQGT